MDAAADKEEEALTRDDNKPDVWPPQEDNDVAHHEAVQFEEVIPAHADQQETVPMVQFTSEPGAHNNHNEEDEDVRIRHEYRFLFFLVKFYVVW